MIEAAELNPKTMMQIEGAPLLPSRLETSILVIIDAQLEYVTGRLPLHGVEAAILECERLLTRARRQDTPVVHIVHRPPPGRILFDASGPYAAIHPRLTPAGDEPTIGKRLPNAFAGTPLHDVLAAIAEHTGRNQLILAGFQTHMCISATARAALDLGYKSTVVASATATRDLASPFGGVVPAQIVHRTALAELADRFAAIAPDTAAL